MTAMMIMMAVEIMTIMITHIVFITIKIVISFSLYYNYFHNDSDNNLIIMMIIGAKTKI